MGHLFSVNIYKDSLEGGNINSLTVPRKSVSSGGENKWGGVHVIITLEVSKCMCTPPPGVMFLFHYSNMTANSAQ